MFNRCDLLGPFANEHLLRDSQAWQALERMEGLEEVKASVREMSNVIIKNAQREEEEMDLVDMCLNRVFIGNPGTGKTTVAKLYGEILSELGLLSKGELILKTASDFVGSALGTSETQTRAILEASVGSVLVIDEAYGLSSPKGTSDPYRAAVIDVMVEQVSVNVMAFAYV
jgi:Holliday junction resolvasome RuvABC ATP-dependent DNA helicase subunit